MHTLSQLLTDLSEEEQFPIDVSLIVDWLKQNNFQDQIYFTPVTLNEDKLLAHLKRWTDISAPYAQGDWIADIRYSNRLNMCWRRFVCTKELMHLFDKPEEMVKDEKTASNLFKHLSSRTVDQEDMSAPAAADFAAIQKALYCLAPLKIVEDLRSAREAQEKSDMQIAEYLRIPLHYIDRIFQDEYAMKYTEARCGTKLEFSELKTG